MPGRTGRAAGWARRAGGVRFPAARPPAAGGTSASARLPGRCGKRPARLAAQASRGARRYSGPQPSAGSLTRTPAGWDWLGTRRADEPIGRFPHYEFPAAAGILADPGNTGDNEEALVIAGYPDMVAEFLAALPDAARDRFAGSLTVNPVMMTPARAGELADPVVRYRADRSRQELLARIRHEPPGGRAAVGLASCLAAADRHAVQTLAVPCRGTMPGYECRRCGALGTTRPGCACSPAAAYPIPDLIEELTAATIRAGGRVQTSDDPPGGIAACLRLPAAGSTRSAA